MELEEFYRRDLNLLIALRILIEEGSVSRAATRLNLSQSAMSRILGRLRDLMDDPLFNRHGQQFVPTTRALEINAALSDPLLSLGQILSPPIFDPAACHQTFKIATTDYAMQTILPFALPRIYEEAPNISLEFLPVQQEHLITQLAYDGGDMAICRSTSSIDEKLLVDSLGLVSVFCMVSKTHPLANTPITLSDYLAYPHAVIAISDGVKALIDQALKPYPPVKLALRAYHLEAAMAVSERLPLIITVPADLAYLVSEKYDLMIKPLPFDFQPFDYSLIWHSRVQHAAGQQWLRHIIKEECGKLIAARIKDMGLL